MPACFDAVVLAGGNASRLGGVDKPAVRIGGASMLERVVAAVTSASRVIVVGPTRDVLSAHPVVWCREEPPGGGPVAALVAGLSRVTAPTVLVLAGDLPGIEGAVSVLVDALGEDDAAVLVDAAGRRNHLAAAWSTTALHRAVARVGEPSGAPARRLYDDVRVVEVADAAGWATDCDTWDDIERARHRAERTSDGSRP